MRLILQCFTLKKRKNDSTQQPQPAPLSCKNHLRPQGFSRRQRHNKHRTAHRHLRRKPRLKAAIADIEKYLADNYGTQTAKLRYKDYANGTSLTSEDTTFAVSLVILTTAGGAAHLPDNVLLLGGVSSTNDVKWLAAEMRNFTNFLMQLCPKHLIQHLAFAFDKTESDDSHIVKEADVTCLRLY